MEVVGELGEVQSGIVTRYSHPEGVCGEGSDVLGVDSRPFLRFFTQLQALPICWSRETC